MSEPESTKNNSSTTATTTTRTAKEENVVIPPLLSSFGAYPNLLKVTEEHRQLFHPVVIFPQTPVVKDSTKRQTSETRRRPLATEEERRTCNKNPADIATLQQQHRPLHDFSIGRYDEHRVGMYESEMFDDLNHDIDGFAGRCRTVHMGIDLAGPVGTPVYAFYPGTVCAAGYNADLGDYGHVVVVKHVLPNQKTAYALYGHLDDKASSWKTGEAIAKGEVLGHMGDFTENGGWFTPHVHFQLSLHPSKTHDMPGVVSLQDRPRALMEYPDPRLIVGPLY